MGSISDAVVRCSAEHIICCCHKHRGDGRVGVNSISYATVGCLGQSIHMLNV